MTEPYFSTIAVWDVAMAKQCVPRGTRPWIWTSAQPSKYLTELRQTDNQKMPQLIWSEHNTGRSPTTMSRRAAADRLIYPVFQVFQLFQVSNSALLTQETTVAALSLDRFFGFLWISLDFFGSMSSDLKDRTSSVLFCLRCITLAKFWISIFRTFCMSVFVARCKEM